jgi:hypothetical protein
MLQICNQAAQGWQCPLCKKVFSPTTAQCLYCPVNVMTTTINPWPYPTTGGGGVTGGFVPTVTTGIWGHNEGSNNAI